jgi:hypothetical protein
MANKTVKEIFLFNSPPRSGNIFFTYLFYLFIRGNAIKTLDIKKYSDKSQKQAVFFRNPYDSISSTIVKSRFDCGLSFNEGDIDEIHITIETYAKEYLEAIKEAKLNFANIYTGKSEDIMKDPVGKIKDIALFFGLTIKDKQDWTNDQVLKEIERLMFETKKIRVDKSGNKIQESLMTDHDGHMPREKIKERVLVDNLIKGLDLEVLAECYNEYMSIKSTNTKEGQRWGY